MIPEKVHLEILKKVFPAKFEPELIKVKSDYHTEIRHVFHVVHGTDAPLMLELPRCWQAHARKFEVCFNKRNEVFDYDWTSKTFHITLGKNETLVLSADDLMNELPAMHQVPVVSAKDEAAGAVIESMRARDKIDSLLLTIQNTLNQYTQMVRSFNSLEDVIAGCAELADLYEYHLPRSVEHRSDLNKPRKPFANQLVAALGLDVPADADEATQ